MNRRLLLTLFLFLAFVYGALAQAPVANIGASATAGCAPLTIVFSDNSTGNPTIWSWDFGGVPPDVTPATSGNKNASVKFSKAGVYTVTLTVTNASGTNTTTKKITVFPAPTADFIADKTTGCYPTTVHFTDKSNAGGSGASIVNWTWSYGDGNVDLNIQNPAHQYTKGGAFPVSLYVKNNYGCVGTSNVATGTITLTNGVIPNYNTNIAGSCQIPITANFTNGTTGPGTLTYSWDFGDGSGTSALPSPSHVYSAVGNYNVKLTATSDQGCSAIDSTVVNIAASTNVSSFTMPDTVCINSTVNFLNTSTPYPNSSSWDYGDATPPDVNHNGQHVYGSLGSFTVTLTNTFATCSGPVSKPIQVVGPPTAAFTGTSLAGCQPPLNASFTDQSVGATAWSWDFGDGSPKSNLQNPTHSYTTYGPFNVTLTASNAGGCTSVKTMNAFVNIVKPIVKIANAPAYGCAPYTFTPTISATQIDGIATYQWDFGNGVTSSLAAPPAQIYPVGSYKVKLTITTNGGCVASDSGIVKVGNIQAIPDFTIVPPSTCVGTNIQFTDQSTGGANQWAWNFGDGSSSILQNPLKSYAKPGTFTVTLTAYNDGCYSLPKTETVVINDPVANFDYSFLCASPNIFSFVDKSTGPLTWAWDFGDGNTANTANPTHTYPPGAPATYTVKLTVTNGACSSTLPKTITANQVTVISASPNPVCKGSTVTFTTTHPDNINSYLFTFGDGTTATSTTGTTTHKYNSPNNYTVTVQTTDKSGCVATSAAFSLTVSGPVADFTASAVAGCKSFSPVFTDKSTSAGSAISSWAWNFGDGGVSTDQNPTHAYTVEGQYPVSLKVKDANGCVDSVTRPSYVAFSAPKASFTTTGTKYGTCSFIKFNNTSKASFGPVTYYWDFQDGTNSAVKDPPLHNFTTAGDYAVTLIVKDGNGCSDTSIAAVPIHIEDPTASFTMSSNHTACPPLVDQFTFTGTYADSVSWTFGDGNVSKAINPSNTYLKPNVYTVNLTVVGFGGCIAQAPPLNVTVDGPYGTIVYNPPLSACEQLDVQFDVLLTNSTQFVWNFGDGTPPQTTTAPSITHHYQTPGHFLPSVQMTDAAACNVTYDGNDSIYIDKINTTSFTIDKPKICDNGDGKITFTDNSTLATGTQIVNYLWDFGDGTVQSGLLPTVTHVFTGVNTYSVAMTITTLHNCGETATLPVQIVGAPQISIGGILPQCEPATITFTGNETTTDPNGPLTWAWDFGNGQTAAIQNPAAVSYPKAGTYTVTLTATDGSGCTTTIPPPAQPLIIYPLPSLDAGPDLKVCQGGPAFQLNVTGDASNSYLWETPVNGTLSCLPCNNPMATSAVSNYFVVTAQTPFGCKANDTVNVVVNTPITLSVSGADSVCLGQSTQLTASGGALYTWTPATGLSNPNIANPVATPIASQVGVQTYSVTGSDDLGCFPVTKTIDVTTFNFPTVDLGPDVTIPVGTAYSVPGNGSSDITEINWIPVTNLNCTDCLTPLANPIKTTDYVVHVENSGGCMASDSLRISVLCDGKNFFIPNTFSPNGDGANDRFIVRGVGLNVIPSLTIYNRWGQVVFEKRNFAPNDEASGWDGTFNGKAAPADVYIYTIQIICDNETLIPYHGNITLIR